MKLSTAISVQAWLGVLTIVAGILALVVPFLQAGDFTPAAIAALVLGAVNVVIAWLTKQTAVRAGLR
jgi:hypothetical protein